MNQRLCVITAALSAWLGCLAAFQSLAAETAKVSANRANIRSSPSTESDIVATLTKGQSVTVVGQYPSSEAQGDEPSTWVKVRLPGSVRVYVAANLIDGKSGAVLSKELRVRSGPGRNYPAVGELSMGTLVVPIRNVDGWTQIQTPSETFGYVAGNLLDLPGVPETPARSASSMKPPTPGGASPNTQAGTAIPLAPRGAAPRSIAPGNPAPPRSLPVATTSSAIPAPPPPRPTPIRPPPLAATPIATAIVPGTPATIPVPDSANAAPANFSPPPTSASTPVNATTPVDVNPPENRTPVANSKTLPRGTVVDSFTGVPVRTNAGTTTITTTTETMSTYYPTDPEFPQPELTYDETRPRRVFREGILRYTFSPDAPSTYQLDSFRRGEKILDYLIVDDPKKVDLAKWRNKRVFIEGDEYRDLRWRTPVLKIISVQAQY